MSEKKVEKIGGPWGGLLIQKINEVIDVLNGEDEEKPEGFQGPRGEPGVPGAGMRKSKDWREEVERIMREDRHRFLRVAHTVYYYKEKLNEMLQLIEEEKEKSHEEGYDAGYDEGFNRGHQALERMNKLSGEG